MNYNAHSFTYELHYCAVVERMVGVNGLLLAMCVPQILIPPFAMLRTDARRGAGVGAHTPRRRAPGLSAETSDVVIPHPLGMGLTLKRHRDGSHRARPEARG